MRPSHNVFVQILNSRTNHYLNTNFIYVQYMQNYANFMSMIIQHCWFSIIILVTQEEIFLINTNDTVYILQISSKNFHRYRTVFQLHEFSTQKGSSNAWNKVGCFPNSLPKLTPIFQATRSSLLATGLSQVLWAHMASKCPVKTVKCWLFLTLSVSWA